MNILEETNSIIQKLNIPVETGVFTSKAPDCYVVLVPLNDSFPLSADDLPTNDMQELRITLFTKNNYISVKNNIVKNILSAGLTITERRYNGFDTGAGYHQYTIDIAGIYEIEEE